jgi:phenylacetate-CoA ligase
MINITPLDAWIKEKASIGAEISGSLLVEALDAYQLRRLNDTIDYAQRNSSFYRKHLMSLPKSPLSALSDIARLPFTRPSDVSKDPFSFMAVCQDQIARIVTLNTSGSTGESKRLFFTDEDLELTVDFFHRGMSTLVKPGQRVAVLLPGERPDSVGDLLARGLARMNVKTLGYGPVKDAAHAAEAILSFEADCLVGIPTQVLEVASSLPGTAIGKCHIKSVLLSTDYAPRAIAERLESVWGCRVFDHYGMTETGLGGGVECEALNGYHLREADLYFEVVDHETGMPCPDGITGEVVFTTLTRKGMPLIRYRTGDIARIIPEPCPCGSVLRRMERVKGRWAGTIGLGEGCVLSLPDIDEALFRLKGLLDYRVTISRLEKGTSMLQLNIYSIEGRRPTEADIQHALSNVDAIAKGLALSILEPSKIDFKLEGRWTTTGTAKRKLIVANPLQ